MTRHDGPHADLARRDRALPALEVLFDRARVATILEQHAGVTVERLKPVYVRYKRSTNCLVGYEVSGSMGTTYVYGKAVRPSDRDKLEKDLARHTAGTWLGAGAAVFGSLGVTFWAYPNDAKVRTLERLANTARARKLLRPFRSDPHVTLVPLSYKPERRFVAAVHRSWQPEPNAVLRMYTRVGFQRARGASQVVKSGAVLRVPGQIAGNSRRYLLVCDWLHGIPLSDRLRSREVGDAMTLVGRALAEMHAQPVTDSTRPSGSYSLRSALQVISELRFVFPELRVPLSALRAQLREFETIDCSPITPVHGDFHPGQILLSDTTVGVVDFDRAGAGPAVGDLACFRAHLEREVLLGVISRDRADEAIERLLRGYATIRQRPSRYLMDAYTALVLVLLLPDPFRRFQAGASDLTARMIDRAASLATSAGSRVAVQ